MVLRAQELLNLLDEGHLGRKRETMTIKALRMRKVGGRLGCRGLRKSRNVDAEGG